MLLQDLLYGVRLIAVAGERQLEVVSICIDSRRVQPQSCFIAIVGSNQNGHDYLPAAIQAGATVLVVEQMPTDIDPQVTYVQVESTAQAAGQMAHLFYGEPSTRFKLVGVTGTNGKTTIATLLYQLFTAMGFTCGLVSTVRNIIGKEVLESTHTTPDAIRLNELLQKMAEAHCSYVFMEVSSHAIHQRRIEGLQFAGGMFSNITHDHLDYHKTFDEYIRVKKAFFDGLPASAFAISNLDDRRGTVMLQNTAARKRYYSLQSLAEYKGKILDNGLTGLQMNINGKEVHFRMIGSFNAYNLLCVYGTALELGFQADEVLQILSSLQGAEGRFDYIVSGKEQIIGIVDYAHTPDALVNVLETIHALKAGGRIFTVVGCGGNRDATKRPVMAQTACDYSDRAIFTSDNPRDEDPISILQMMEAGLSSSARKKYLTVPDRKEAIKTAVALAQSGDIILIAGKGHEKYQEIKGVKHPFDDKEVLKTMFLENDK